ncbi:MAG: hypothetical protein WD689_00385 [Gaiellaceae bacterium]
MTPSRKLRTLAAAALTTALAASVALAAPPSEQGRAACKPSKAVVLKGTLVSFGAGSFVIDVKKANKHGRALAGPQTVAVDDKTKFRPKRYDDFKDAVAGFRMNVHAKVCKGEPVAAVVARRVTLHPAKTEDSGTTPSGTTP